MFNIENTGHEGKSKKHANEQKVIFVEDQDPRKRIGDDDDIYIKNDDRVSLESLAKLKREALTSK
jgi:hypothetical protein